MGLRRQRSFWSATAQWVVFAIVFHILFALPCTAYAYLPMPEEDYVPTEEDIATGYIPDDSPAPGIHDGSDEALRGSDDDIPARYDGRELDPSIVTPVKSQGLLGTCWAFAVMGTLESTLLRKGVADASLDFSERHLIYFLYHESPDPLGNTAGDFTVPVNDHYPEDGPSPYLMTGANYEISTYALAAWLGVADENSVPTYADLLSAYNAATKPIDEGFLSEVALDASAAYVDSYHLTQAIRIPFFNDDESSNTADIKRAIMERGAVGFSMRYDSSCYNQKNGAFFNPQQKGTGHAVVAVGWDDEFPRDSFTGNKKPESDGAWICKNSYGLTSTGGYIYLSYEDPQLTKSTARVYAYDLERADALDNIYQYDGTAGTCLNYVSSGGAIANVYEVRANEGGCERLKAVSFALGDANVQYSIQVYANPTNAADPTSGTAVLARPVQGTTSYAGYYTVDLGDGALFDEGDTFSVMVTLSKKDQSDIMYNVDCTYGGGNGWRYGDSNNWYHCGAHVEPGQSFERDTTDSAWDDLSLETFDGPDEPACSARLKAFTVNEPLEQTIDLAEAQMGSIGRQRYTSKELTPNVTVTYGNEVLRKDRDYRVIYTDNVQVGTAHVQVEGIGRYFGELSTSFEIYAEPAWARLWGNTALDTMRSIVQADGVFTAQTTDTVVVATADGFKDALAAAGLAGRLKAPVLITSGKALSSQTASELRRLKPSKVIVVGGPVAIRAEVVGAIQSAATGATVHRVYGKTAVDTALELWREGSGWGDTAIVVTSDGFKDALAVAPYSYAKGAPIFLAKPSKTPSGRVLSDTVCNTIIRGNFSRVIIVGGELAVSETVEDQIRSIASVHGRSIEVKRLPGANAIDTSRLVASFELGEGMELTHMAVATSAGYKDALCGAPLAGAQNSVLVLASKTGGYQAFNAIYDRNRVVHVHVLGGTAAISEDSWNYITTR